MRIYEGSPRQDWQEVLRSIGSYVDHERLKELLFLELEGGFILQGLAPGATGAWSESPGALAKRTIELTDDQVSAMLDEGEARRGSADDDTPHPDASNYYELALRVIGAYVDEQKAHDIFFFEQDGSFVLRLFASAGSHGNGHQLAEFTHDEILAMIGSAPEHRQSAPEPPGPS